MDVCGRQPMMAPELHFRLLSLAGKSSSVPNCVTDEKSPLLQCRPCQVLFFAHLCIHSEKSALSLYLKTLPCHTNQGLARNQFQVSYLDPTHASLRSQPRS